MVRKGLTESAIEKAKNFVKGSTLMQIEMNRHYALWLAELLSYTGSPWSLDDYLSGLEKISREEVMNVVRLLTRENASQIFMYPEDKG